MKGFTFMYKGKDIFVQTNAVKKTENLVSKIIRQMVNVGYDLPDNASTKSDIMWYLQKAECDLHTLPDGRSYYEIHGKGFGGKGSFLDDGKTVIITI